MSDGNLIRLNTLQMTYVPYPFGVMAPVFEQNLYEKLLDSFPPLELFQFREKFGNKYSLSEKNNPDKYDRFIRETPVWQRLHSYIKSDDFIFSILGGLKEKNVDLGFRRTDQSRGVRVKKMLRSFISGRIPSVAPPLRSRFEFSALPAAGGLVIPHTDAPGKFVTLVFSMVRPDEWQEAWGGGTDILVPKQEAQSYNFYNKQMDYAETQTLHTVPYKPNQAMIFVKTYNSLHGVKVMTGPEKAIRRTLTVVIERA